MKKFDFDEQDRQLRFNIKVYTIALIIALIMFAFATANAQNLREVEFVDGIKTYIALPTSTQDLDVLCTEIDTVNGGNLFYTDVLFWGAEYCMFTTQNDTAVVISRTGSRHLVLLKNCNWRNKHSNNFLKWFENE